MGRTVRTYLDTECSRRVAELMEVSSTTRYLRASFAYIHKLLSFIYLESTSYISTFYFYSINFVFSSLNFLSFFLLLSNNTTVSKYWLPTANSTISLKASVAVGHRTLLVFSKHFSITRLSHHTFIVGLDQETSFIIMFQFFHCTLHASPWNPKRRCEGLHVARGDGS